MIDHDTSKNSNTKILVNQSKIVLTSKYSPFPLQQASTNERWSKVKCIDRNIKLQKA